MTDKDNRRTLKVSDDDVFERFRKVKAEYDEQRDERVTDTRTLDLLIDDVPVEREADTDTERILEQLKQVQRSVDEHQSNRH